jgi:hypothetical protein
MKVIFKEVISNKLALIKLLKALTNENRSLIEWKNLVDKTPFAIELVDDFKQFESMISLCDCIYELDIDTTREDNLIALGVAERHSIVDSLTKKDRFFYLLLKSDVEICNYWKDVYDMLSDEQLFEIWMLRRNKNRHKEEV